MRKRGVSDNQDGTLFFYPDFGELVSLIKFEIMKKLLFSIVLLLIVFSLKAQKATFQNDTARYNGKTFVVNDTITLGYGSQANKNFAFIMIGSGMSATELDKKWAKNYAVIDKIYLGMGKSIMIRAKLVDKTVNLIGGNKLFINLEAAVDNK